MSSQDSDGATEAGDGTPAAARPPPGRLTAALQGALQSAHAQASVALDLGDPVEAVHELRKSFKRLRALLRLAGRAADPALARTARAARRELAQTARQLAPARDAAAREDALDDLVAKAGLSTATRRAAARALGPATAQEGLGLHRARLESQLAALAEVLARLGAALDDKALVAALAAEYARARRIGRAADPREGESLHALRKAVVAQRYQMELAGPLWPALGEVWVDELQRLRDKLGKHQDLAVLRAGLEARPPLAEGAALWRGDLGAAIEARQAKLAGGAQRLHARLFAETPKGFRRRLRAYMSVLSEGK